MYLYLPHLISFFRLLITPFVVWCLYRGDYSNLFIAMSLFCLGCISDTLDGAVARSLGLASKVGAILDHTADKILIITTLLALVAFKYLDSVDAIPIGIIISRDLMTASLRELATYQGIAVTSNYLGKTKTLFQMLAIMFIFSFYVFSIPLFYGRFLLWFSSFLAVLSLGNYFLYFLKKYING